ncbi:SpaA isopeptide-forming pilin-related protein [Adlercreutzia equolifaciens]|uniref:SpaA isopeptide-forming pilin-related protein n=1 Tax=Adlercreutzia equolifaciens TaxID=446660 RepID=UPI0003898B49|nr:FctA domain-containing protein [Adlercreutzia equolifaciens]RFT81468.1 hypothetical protein DX903_11285 [Adlercreutzia equolifaciens]BAN78230.1 hypothetical protein AEQU_2261 [Adlercreutzia equolifaciens DSM 19450]
MIKLLENKSIIKFLGIALSILLVIALVPQINTAYGSKDDIPDEGTDPTTELVVPEEEATEGEEGEEGIGTSEEEAVVIEKDSATVNEDKPEANDAVIGLRKGPQKAAPGKTDLWNNAPTHEVARGTTVTLDETLLYNDGMTHTLTVNGNLHGDIKISNGTTLTIIGTGTIKGTGNGSVINVEGSTLTIGKQDSEKKYADYGTQGPKITNGTGTRLNTQGNDEKVWSLCGGGVLAQRDNNGTGSTFNFYSGLIEGNKALTGGGVFIDKSCTFVMDGGKVYNNETNYEELTENFTDTEKDETKRSAHEGGGIFFAGANGSEIRAGLISTNHTKTDYDWGGGGLFVNAGTTLKMGSSHITQNKAAGLGGGISGCPHAKIGIGTIGKGVAVFKNEAEGGYSPGARNTYLSFLTNDSAKTTGKKVACGDFLAFGTPEDVDKTYGSVRVKSGVYASGKNAITDTEVKSNFTPWAQDYYCTFVSFISGTDLGSHPNGIAWEGYYASVPSGKTLITTNDMTCGSVNFKVGEIIDARDQSLGLTSTATEDAYKADRTVFIEKNTSTTHGGGIGCNGALVFGALNEYAFDAFTFDFTKQLSNALTEQNISLKDKEFSFTLTDDEGKTYTATNDATGKVTFSGIELTDSEKNTLKSSSDEYPKVTKTLKLSEAPTSNGIQSPLTSDATVTIQVSFTRETLEFDNTGDKTSITTYKVKKIESVRIQANGQEPGSTVTNIWNPQAEVTIPVIKISDGIPAGEFIFKQKEISEIDNVVDTEGMNLRESGKLNSIAQSAGDTDEEKIAINLDSSAKEIRNGTANFKFKYAPRSNETHWYAIAEIPGSTEGADYDGAAYLLKIDVTVNKDTRTVSTDKTIWKAMPGKTELTQIDADKVEVVFENVAIKYAGFDLNLTKQILSTLEDKLQLNGKQFDFELYEGNPISEDAKRIATGKTNKENGALSLAIANTRPEESNPYAKQVFENPSNNTFTFTLREAKTSDGFMATIPDAKVEVTLSASGTRTEQDGHTVFLVTPTVQSVKVNDVEVENADKSITVTNRYTPNGSWQFKANKYFYGVGSASTCEFSLVELQGEPKLYEPLSKTPKKDGTEKTKSVSADALKDGREEIVFDPITYQVDGEATEGATEQPRDDRGDHYYLVTETGNAASKDTTAYVVKVTVTLDENDKGKLVATETMVGYADNINAPLNPSTARPVFYNTDTYDMVAAANYSVYAASGEPVDQVCYVDPKVIKKLEGRAIKSGEFAFKLIEVQNYDDTEGQLISATANDEFGMVDFDKANNVSGDLENPSCLVYSRPGTYYYRVIEDTSQGGMKDQSVVYSDQIITFTTVIEQDETTGQLVCTDMYYGWWDKEAGKNVRYDEQYLDYADQPSNIGDMSKLDTNWHPTITNRTRAMDLQVRKTSVTDRDEGLVGATYALYAVNDNAQGDVMLAEATSEEGGWITYKNVSLTTNNLYYFKEVAAPAGHTVSEFRSPYFYLVEDATSPNGYTLKYADKKDDAASAMAGQAEIAAMATENDEQASATDAQAADSRAGDNQQPGHSADGNVLLTYDRDGGVYDEATQLDVNKLDTRTHEWVEGAELAIIEKDTGREVVRWTSGKASKQLEKVLNVGTAYILRELKAPENYQVADDVEFIIDDYGAVTITKGVSNGNAELSGTTITLYDTMLDAEVVDRVERERSIPQTGDLIPVAGIAAVALTALVVVVVARRRREI